MQKKVTRLNKLQLSDLTRVMLDIYAFANKIFIIHPVRGKVKFDLYPYQKSVLWEFLNNRFNIVLKFRQAGLTELIALYCLWLAMYHDNKKIVIISIKDKVAKNVLKKIKYMYKNLEPHLQVPIVNGHSQRDLGTVTEMEFSNGSVITSVPTTEDVGRSEGLSLLVIDEAAIIRWANKIWASALPTLSTGGSAILNSTPYGVGNFFHKTWVDALAGGNPFNPIRLVWTMHPERDIEWYRTMRLALGKKKTAQEIDGDFLSSGDTVFDLVDIRAIEDCLIDKLPIERRLNDSLLIYEKPKKNARYFIGVDVATGRSRDFSAFSIMDKFGNEVACFKGKIPIDRLRKLLMDLGQKYNWALLAVEANDIGEGLVKWLQESGYRNLYYSRRLLKEKGESRPKQDKVPGWYTTKKNRPIIIDELEEDIRLDNINIRSPFFVSEAYTFVYNDANKPVALNKGKKRGSQQEDVDDSEEYTDDSILATAITNFIRKGKVSTTVVSPQ